MKKLVKQELNKILEEYKWESVKDISWYSISHYQKLSEDFIREFKDKVCWNYIFMYQKLSEDFIREFELKVDWVWISKYQKLSEDFIREFELKVDWEYISYYQKLSEDFIREFKDKVNWGRISSDQKLSEDFIREFQNRVIWYCISKFQPEFSKEFLKEFKDKLNIEIYNKVHQKKSYKQKLEEVKRYAEEHKLKTDDKYLYAFREHDKNNSGIFNKTVSYKKGKYYRDWHCDLRKEADNSFGFGIWPKGNTPVKVKIADWGVNVNRDDGKARVWGFEIVEN